MKKNKKLSSAQAFAINVLVVNKTIPWPTSCYFHSSTGKFLLRHGIAKIDGDQMVLSNPKDYSIKTKWWQSVKE